MRRMALTALIIALFIPTLAHAQATISMDRARQIALNNVPGNQGVKSGKLKTEHGVLLYKFDIRTAGPGHREVLVDARTGAIVTNKHEEGTVSKVARKTEKATEKAAKATAKAVNETTDKIFGKDEISRMNLRISEGRARRIALSRVPGGTIKDADLKREHGVIVWDIKVDRPGKGHDDIRIDANTGAVLKDEYHK